MWSNFRGPLNDGGVCIARPLDTCGIVANSYGVVVNRIATAEHDDALLVNERSLRDLPNFPEKILFDGKTYQHLRYDELTGNHIFAAEVVTEQAQPAVEKTAETWPDGGDRPE